MENIKIVIATKPRFPYAVFEHKSESSEFVECEVEGSISDTVQIIEQTVYKHVTAFCTEQMEDLTLEDDKLKVNMVTVHSPDKKLREISGRTLIIVFSESRLTGFPRKALRSS